LPCFCLDCSDNGLFGCEASGVCIPQYLTTDGYSDCFDASDERKYDYVSPQFGGETYCFCLVRLSVTQFVSATPLKLLNRISWNLVDSKDTICSCAYYQEILIAWILWELCPFGLRNFPKFTTEAACQCNSSETTEQNFMKLGR
jgi:hypothetical protein